MYKFIHYFLLAFSVCSENLTKIIHNTYVNDTNNMVIHDDHNRRLLNHYWNDYQWDTGVPTTLEYGDCHTESIYNYSNILSDTIYNINNIPIDNNIWGIGNFSMEYK